MSLATRYRYWWDREKQPAWFIELEKAVQNDGLAGLSTPQGSAWCCEPKRYMINAIETLIDHI